jgi:ribosome-associated protein
MRDVMGELAGTLEMSFIIHSTYPEQRRRASNVEDLVISPTLIVPGREIKFRFARSGGPGGQNVNKVESRVELLFDLNASVAFSDSQKHRIHAALQKRLDAEGILHIVVQESRSQWQNREFAVMRLAELLKAALTPRKKRVATRPSRGSKEERFREKKKRGETKRSRGQIED